MQRASALHSPARLARPAQAAAASGDVAAPAACARWCWPWCCCCCCWQMLLLLQWTTRVLLLQHWCMPPKRAAGCGCYSIERSTRPAVHRRRWTSHGLSWHEGNVESPDDGERTPRRSCGKIAPRLTAAPWMFAASMPHWQCGQCKQPHTPRVTPCARVCKLSSPLHSLYIRGPFQLHGGRVHQGRAGFPHWNASNTVTTS